MEDEQELEQEQEEEYSPVEMHEIDNSGSILDEAFKEPETPEEKLYPEQGQEEAGKEEAEAPQDRHAMPETREVPYQEYGYALPENWTMSEEQTQAANTLFSGMEMSQEMVQKLTDMYTSMGFERASYHDVPDHYDLKMRSGFFLEGEHLERTEAFFHSMGLSNEQAQALCDKYMDEYGKPENYRGIQLRKEFGMDDAHMERVNKMFKDWGLTYKQAQTACDFFMDAVAERQNAVVDSYVKMQEEEIRTVQHDPEIGGTNMPKTLAYAKEVLDKFGGPELRKAIEDHGMGNNPHLIRLLSRIGKSLKGDTLVTGRPNKRTDKAHAMYPGMN